MGVSPGRGGSETGQGSGTVRPLGYENTSWNGGFTSGALNLSRKSDGIQPDLRGEGDGEDRRSRSRVSQRPILTG